MASRVLERARRRLEELRAGRPCDLDDSSRHMSVVQALQFDLRTEDRPIVRELLTRAIVAEENNEPWNDSLRLATYLLSRLRNIEDVALLWRAKTASFDTQCGLHEQMLYATGLDATRAYVREHVTAIEKGAALLRYLEASDEPLDVYWDGMASMFPEEEPAWTEEQEMDLACAIGEQELARELIERWETSCPTPSPTQLRDLAWRWEALGEPARAASTWERKLVLEAPSEPRDRVNGVVETVDAWLTAARAEEAWRVVEREASPFVPTFSAWGRGLLAQRAFDIAARLGSNDVFAWTEGLLDGLRPREDTVSKAAFEQGIVAAGALGDEAAVARLRTQVDGVNP